MKKNNKGFTLVELIAVLILLGIIIVLIAPSLLGTSESSKEKLKEAKIEALVLAAGNYLEDNTNTYSDCNSYTSQEKISEKCILTIEKLIEEDYFDRDENKENKNIVIDPVTNEAMTGQILACYNMNTGVFITGYYETSVLNDLKDKGELCASTGIHTLALQDNSIAISWHEGTDFTTNIYSIGEYEGDFTVSPSEQDGVRFEIEDNKKLRVTFTGSEDIFEGDTKTVTATITGKYKIIDENGNESTAERTTTFDAHIFDKISEDATTLTLTIRPTGLLEENSGFGDDVTLTCIQKNRYGCEIDVKDFKTYTGINISTVKGYKYIDNYSLNTPIEDYYEAGKNQNGTISSGKYRIYKDNLPAGSDNTLKSGSILYIGIRPIVSTVTFDENWNDSQSTKKVAYSMTYDKTPVLENNVNILKTESLPTPTREGYNFLGWYTSESGGTKITDTSTVNIIENQTLYAHWEIIKYNIELNLTGATTSTANLTVNHGETATYTVVADKTHKLSGATVSCTNGVSSSIDTSTGVVSIKKVTSDATCTVTLPIAYKCSTGTLTEDPSKGYICVTSASSQGWVNSIPYDCECKDVDCNCVTGETCGEEYACNCVTEQECEPDYACNCVTEQECEPDYACNCVTEPECEPYDCKCEYKVTVENYCYNECVKNCEVTGTCNTQCNADCTVEVPVPGTCQTCHECTPKEVCETCPGKCTPKEVCTSTCKGECTPKEVCKNTCQDCEPTTTCDTCQECKTCYDTVYYCESGWSTYSGSGSSLKCYRKATTN